MAMESYLKKTEKCLLTINLCWAGPEAGRPGGRAQHPTPTGRISITQQQGVPAGQRSLNNSRTSVASALVVLCTHHYMQLQDLSRMPHLTSAGKMVRISYAVFYEQQETRGQGNALARALWAALRETRPLCGDQHRGCPSPRPGAEPQLRAGQGSDQQPAQSPRSEETASPARTHPLWASLSCPHWLVSLFLTRRLRDVPSRLPAQGENWEHMQPSLWKAEWLGHPLGSFRSDGSVVRSCLSPAPPGNGRGGEHHPAGARPLWVPVRQRGALLLPDSAGVPAAPPRPHCPRGDRRWRGFRFGSKQPPGCFTGK